MGFKAQFPGTCAPCGEAISPGQYVAFVDGELAHSGACENEISAWSAAEAFLGPEAVPVAPRLREAEVCPSCRLVLPLTKICEECE